MPWAGTFDNVINLRIHKKLYGPREIIHPGAQ